MTAGWIVERIYQSDFRATGVWGAVAPHIGCLNIMVDDKGMMQLFSTADEFTVAAPLEISAMARIAVTDAISLDEGELSERFILSSGPGGQNVNKVASAVQLRFDVAKSPSLPQEVKQRLLQLAGRRVAGDGVVTITARGFRSQERNREDARARLIALIRRAAEVPKPRRATRPPRSSVERRLQAKAIRSRVKKTRGNIAEE